VECEVDVGHVLNISESDNKKFGFSEVDRKIVRQSSKKRSVVPGTAV